MHAEPMPLRAGPATLWSRAVVLATVATSLGTVAHMAAGGLLPGVIGLLLVVGVLTVLAAPALTGAASYRRIAVIVAGGQATAHAVFTATSGHSDPHAAAAQSASAMRVPERAGGVRDALAIAPDRASSGPDPIPHAIQHLLADVSGPNIAMAGAHLVAAAIVAFWLWRGEQALWTVIALLARRWSALPVSGPCLAVMTTTRQQAPAPHVRPLAQRTTRTPASRRGPPRSSTSLAHSR